MSKIPEKARELLDRGVIVHLATTNADGSPQVSPIWVERDGALLRFTTAEGRAKVRNLRRDPRLALSLVDPEEPGNSFSIRGSATAIERRGWDLIDRLARLYSGTDGFRRIEGMTRVDVDVEVDRVN